MSILTPNEPTEPAKRKKHSHRCQTCGHAVYCYKGGCTKPQRIEACENCKNRIRTAKIGGAQ